MLFICHINVKCAAASMCGKVLFVPVFVCESVSKITLKWFVRSLPSILVSRMNDQDHNTHANLWVANLKGAVKAEADILTFPNILEIFCKHSGK